MHLGAVCPIDQLHSDLPWASLGKCEKNSGELNIRI